MGGRAPTHVDGGFASGRAKRMSHLEPTLWRDITEYLRKRHASVCRQWFDELEPMDLNGGVLQIRTSNSIQQNYLQRKCLDQFNEAAQSVTGALVAVRFVTAEELEQDDPQREAIASPVAVAAEIGASAAHYVPGGRTQRTIELPHDDQEYDPEYDQIVLSP